MRTLLSKHKIYFSTIVAFFLIAPALQAQKVVHISGRVIDNTTKRALPFVNVVIKGKNQGAMTNYEGYYKINLQQTSDKIVAQSIGYQKQVKAISQNENQIINFALIPKSVDLNEVVVSGKRLRYRNKNNPAVALIRKVIQNKKLNRKGSLKFYQFDKYDKIEFALNKADEKILRNKAFNKFRFAFQYNDTSELTGEPYLPFFLKETTSKVYYRKTPHAQKQYITGTKMSLFPGFMDKRGFGSMINRLFQNIDVYDNNIFVLTNQFVSPLSTIAPNIYKFRIIDTLDINGYNCINLAFQPRNKADFAFAGNLYITNDKRYAIVKAVLGIPRGINLNFVRGLKFVEEYKFINNKIWMLSKSRMAADFNLGKQSLGMFGWKTDYYSNYLLNHKQPDKVYAGVEKKIILPTADLQTNRFWAKNRLAPLQKNEKNIYALSDSIQRVPAYKRSVNLLMLLYEGYWNIGKIDIGPVNTFYGFNSVEGRRLRFALRTSPKFSKRLMLTGNIAYGFVDKKYKYGGSAIWSLNKIPVNKRPNNTITIKYQNGIKFPGMEIQEMNQENFFLSFKRGVADKMLYFKLFEIEHYLKWGHGFSTTLSLRHVTESPGGNWQFNAQGYPLSQLSASESALKIRFAPNEKYYQGMDYRTPMITRYPVIQLNYIQGFKNVFQSNFSYSKLSVSIFKRFYLGLFGYLDNDVEAGRVFGSGIPYPLLYLHRANQSYSYEAYSYNMMNFLEFVSDKYVTYFGEYHFNGFLFNQIPLLKHLKFRTVVSFKVLFGGLDNNNNPNITPGLMPFPTDLNGNPTTFVLNKGPYMEASVGIENIFHLFRVDLVKRLSYLNNPDVRQYGVRLGFKVDF